jgi:hypothetical protein
VANAHTEAAAAREVKLQTEVVAARKIQRIKEAMARQAHKDAADPKKKLEDADERLRTRPLTSRPLWRVRSHRCSGPTPCSFL